ncbi:magnesium and cobalt transport protein CorA [Agromyces seonyuensis]|uniref:magnesium and cobalt transport protein CorA n=1 Tax=Agromyces seonyuensis TaxID=2662446 RepID=UPI0030148CC5
MPGSIATAPTPYFTRFVVDGIAAPAPEIVSVARAQEFADEGSDHLALTVFPTPDPESIAELATAWDLHPLLVEDLLHAGQRPKLERYGDVLFVVLRAARYLDEAEEVEFSEFHVLVRDRSIAVLCQDRRWLDGTPGSEFEERTATPDRRERTLLADRELLRLGPEAVLYRLLDAIVDTYPPVLRGLGIDREQIERQVFSGDPAAATRIYLLSREAVDMQQTTASLGDLVESLRNGLGKYDVPDALRAYLQDVADHLERAGRRSAELRDALTQILAVNSTLVAQRQNEDMKKISGWAAILFAPTLIAAVYGMNFDEMPELHWSFGYPMAIGLMLAFAGVLYWIFKRSKWM